MMDPHNYLFLLCPYVVNVISELLANTNYVDLVNEETMCEVKTIMFGTDATNSR